MWFGNLVTMKWWNDLWLNESFATYMSYLVMAEVPELKYFPSPWGEFNDRKYAGIYKDQFSTTHPVSSEVKDTLAVDQIFDAISYSKGASFLKQIHYVIGHDSLKAALHIYFRKHQYKNTELTNFIESMQTAYDVKDKSEKSMGEDFDFTKWCDSWLLTSGSNQLYPVAQYGDNDTLKSLSVK